MTNPVLCRFKASRCASLEDVRLWVAEELRRGKDEHGRTRTGTDSHNLSVPVPDSPCPSVSVPPPAPDTLAANAALSLLNLACYLLDRQIAAQAAAFEQEGGFTERLYRVRSQRRQNPPRP